MQKLIIKGKKNLKGTITISGSKNATLPILAASILSKKVILKNVFVFFRSSLFFRSRLRFFSF